MSKVYRWENIPAENAGSDAGIQQIDAMEDVVSEVPNEEFIVYVYKTILGREPDDDDLQLRLAELGRGKTREDLIKSILESKESRRRILAEVAKSITSGIRL